MVAHMLQCCVRHSVCRRRRRHRHLYRIIIVCIVAERCVRARTKVAIDSAEPIGSHGTNRFLVIV